MPPPPRNTMGSRAGPGPLGALGALGRANGVVNPAVTRVGTRGGVLLLTNLDRTSWKH